VKRNGQPVFEFQMKPGAEQKTKVEAHPSQALIHNQDGMIADERTYDADPFPPRA
jgi:hypothetical protein